MEAKGKEKQKQSKVNGKKCRQNGYALYILMCIVGKSEKQIGLFFGNKDNTLKRPICLIEFQQQHQHTHTRAPY